MANVHAPLQLTDIFSQAWFQPMFERFAYTRMINRLSETCTFMRPLSLAIDDVAIDMCEVNDRFPIIYPENGQWPSTVRLFFTGIGIGTSFTRAPRA